MGSRDDSPKAFVIQAVLNRENRQAVFRRDGAGDLNRRHMGSSSWQA